MTSYTLKGRITSDRRLEVEVPDEVPAGEAEITLHPLALRAPNASAALEAIRKRRTPAYRTRAEADAFLEEMRSEWDLRDGL